MSVQCRVLLLVALASVPFSADGQITAKQGEAPPDQTKQFRSPMSLELPFAVAKPMFWGKGEIRTDETRGLRNYFCDGVNFLDFSEEISRPRRGKLHGRIHYTIANEPSIDKRADVVFELRSGDRLLYAIGDRDVKVEEGRQNTRTVPFALAQSDIRDGADVTLKVTVTVKVDD